MVANAALSAFSMCKFAFKQAEEGCGVFGAKTQEEAAKCAAEAGLTIEEYLDQLLPEDLDNATPDIRVAFYSGAACALMELLERLNKQAGVELHRMQEREELLCAIEKKGKLND